MNSNRTSPMPQFVFVLTDAVMEPEPKELGNDLPVGGFNKLDDLGTDKSNVILVVAVIVPAVIPPARDVSALAVDLDDLLDLVVGNSVFVVPIVIVLATPDRVVGSVWTRPPVARPVEGVVAIRVVVIVVEAVT